MIHYAQLENSPRLQRLYKFLLDGMPHTTRDIVHGAEIMAVSTAVDELRENGFVIECRPVGRGRYEYQLQKPAPACCKQGTEEGVIPLTLPSPTRGEGKFTEGEGQLSLL